MSDTGTSTGTSTAPPTGHIRVFVGTEAARRMAEALAEAVPSWLGVAVTLYPGPRPPHGCLVDRIGDTEIGPALAIIDGLDPYAQDAVRSIRANARQARIPRLTYRPRGWERHPLDRWVEVRDLAGAAQAIASVARVALLAVPPNEVPAFAGIGGLRFPTRLAALPARWTLPARFQPLVFPPPYSVAGDIALLRRCGAQAVVMRATGAETDLPLVRAARALDLPIVMIRRPVERNDVPARSIEVVVDWVDKVIHPAEGPVARPVSARESR